MSLLDLLWGTTARRYVTACTAIIGSVSGAVTAIPPAWSSLGLPVPASVGFVHAEIGKVRVAEEGTRSIAKSLQIQLTRDKRLRLSDQLIRWKIELEKTIDPGTRAVIQQQVLALELERADTDQELHDLMNRPQTK